MSPHHAPGPQKHRPDHLPHTLGSNTAILLLQPGSQDPEHHYRGPAVVQSLTIKPTDGSSEDPLPQFLKTVLCPLPKSVLNCGSPCRKFHCILSRSRTQDPSQLHLQHHYVRAWGWGAATGFVLGPSPRTSGTQWAPCVLGCWTSAHNEGVSEESWVCSRYWRVFVG